MLEYVLVVLIANAVMLACLYLLRHAIAIRAPVLLITVCISTFYCILYPFLVAHIPYPKIVYFYLMLIIVGAAVLYFIEVKFFSQYDTGDNIAGIVSADAMAVVEAKRPLPGVLKELINRIPVIDFKRTLSFIRLNSTGVSGVGGPAAMNSPGNLAGQENGAATTAEAVAGTSVAFNQVAATVLEAGASGKEDTSEKGLEGSNGAAAEETPVDSEPVEICEAPVDTVEYAADEVAEAEETPWDSEPVETSEARDEGADPSQSIETGGDRSAAIDTSLIPGPDSPVSENVSGESIVLMDTIILPAAKDAAEKEEKTEKAEKAEEGPIAQERVTIGNLVDRAFERLASGDSTGAVDYFFKALRLTPPPKLAVMVCIEIVSVYLAEGRKSQALAVLEMLEAVWGQALSADDLVLVKAKIIKLRGEVKNEENSADPGTAGY